MDQNVTASDYFSEANSVEVFLSRMTDEVDPRFRRIMGSLVEHLHAFIKDVELTRDEWEVAIDFLTATGKKCSTERQEFILLSDVLGVSMLVDAINNRRSNGETENTVLGPFHVDGAPELEMGDTITKQGGEETCLFEGRVLDIEGQPIEGARIDVWSDDENGFYDVQQPDIQPPFNNRGIFTTGADGVYAFRGIKPVSYPIPDDGPVGQLLAALGRHPYRPAHMHFIITAPGYDTIVTHTFVEGDPYLESDAVFGVKESLVASYRPGGDSGTTWRTSFDFVMAKAGAGASG